MYKDSTLHLPLEYQDVIDASLRVLNPSWEYAFRSNMEKLPQKYLQFYKVYNKDILVPRQYCDESIDTLQIEDKTIWDNPAPFKFLGNLFAPQKEALDIIDSHAGNLIIEMPTGSGKTIVGLAAAALFGRKTLVLTHKRVLSDQWKAQFKEFTDAHVVQVHNKADVERVRNIAIVLAQTVRSQNEMFKEYKFYNMFDMIIIDECHRFSATTFHDAISQFPGRIRLGLTATAFRNDGLEMVFQYAIGKVHKIASKINKMPIVVIRQTSFNRNMSAQGSYAVAITHLAKNLQRNRMILADLQRCLENGRTVLVLTDRLYQARYLYKNAKKDFKDSKICILTGSDEMEVTPKEADVIIATYGVAKEGVDIPALDTLFYATPISDRISITQSIGRLLRGQPDKDLLVFDYVDKTTLGRALYYKRLQIYSEININDIRKKSGDI